MGRLTWTVCFASMLVTIGPALAGSTLERLPSPLAKIGATQLRTADGRSTTLHALTRPNVPTVVSFWATACIPCRVEARTLASFRKRYSASRLNILYLNLDSPDTRKAIPGYLSSANATGLAYQFADDKAYHRIAGDKEVAIPRTFVFGANGLTQRALTGYVIDPKATYTPLAQAVMHAMQR